MYLLTEQNLTADAVRASVADTDGILQVTGRGEDWAEIAIWNPDGSTAELSGNGTRIAARWLARETGAPVVRIRVGPREVVARMLDGDEARHDDTQWYCPELAPPCNQSDGARNHNSKPN